MTTNRFFNIKKDDSYLTKFTHDTIIFGENLFKIISKTFTNDKCEILNEFAGENSDSISFCSEVLPFYCKSEVIHQESIFNVRFGHSSIFYNNFIYIYGGNQKISNFNSKLIQYDIGTQIFKRIEEINPPKPRYFATLNLIYSSELNEYCLLLYGGKRNSYITNDTYIFIISKNTWKHVKAKFSPPPIYGHVSFKYKNVIFIHGGNMGNSETNSDIWCFFEEENKWVKVMSKSEYYKRNTSKPCGRYFHSCAICVSNQGNDIKAYIFGGLNNNNKCVEDVFWSYSVSNGKWNQIKNSIGEMPVERYGHSSIVLNGRWFVIFGGFNLRWYHKAQLLDIHAYDIKLNTWSNLNVYGMLPVTHHFYGNIVQIDENGYFLIFGGLRNNIPCSNVYKYTPLFASHYFKILHNKLDELHEKIESFETNPKKSLNPLFRKEINELKKSLSGITFTFVRYIQLISDINEKIKISNKLAKINYSRLSAKFESQEKYYKDLIKRTQALNDSTTDSSCEFKEGLSKESSEKENLINQCSSSSFSSQDNNEVNYESLIYEGINENKKV
ncbi:kelch protein, putative [Plasmodium gallinaceum]|uniref:Kelch protein, putative n=1 Tax=Plasmodium gallinaceum TaxID=5849 RepID=A0A1J1GV17_PLAGA|nr:kelch protein, putative [Plasmodium gallinaceum]CRG96306.1 kelch protein, putative [Plasmodium gallinaceum]